MKNLRTPLVCLCMTVFSICSKAQTTHPPLNKADYNKPKLFTALPETITISISEIEVLMRKEAGEQSSLMLDNSRQASFSGTVISVSSPSANDDYRSIVIRSDNYNGARLHLVRAKREDGSIAYEGRIISNQHGDAYLLKSDGNNIVFTKKGYYDLINE